MFAHSGSLLSGVSAHPAHPSNSTVLDSRSTLTTSPKLMRTVVVMQELHGLYGRRVP